MEKVSPGSVLLCIFTAGLFAVSILTSKFVYQYGVEPLFFSTVRSVFCVAMCSAFILVKGGEWRMPKPARAYILPMCVMLLMVSFGYPTAMKYIPAGLATLVFYLWPMFVLIISAIQQREFPGIRRFSIFAVAFAGLGLVFGPAIGDVRWEGLAAATIAALGASLFCVIVPKVTRHASSMTINIHTNVVVGLILFGGAVLDDQLQMPTAAIGWYAMIGAGLLYGLGMIMIFYAINRAGPVTSSILFNSEPLIVTLLATVIFAEILEPVQYAGILIVVVSMMLASARTAVK
ncbi:MAG: DMT family transporter [Rhodospirillales bacterium]|jgi:drug/metabolite transporter (DMT)-like permease|nr:DMT family transporter [Rhodospirillales bacterium]MBT4039165.1 DMT family transporter [Rhodospirillales bacterium]MBT4628303.1 DMT family transporter [Rhodospirillales bacterium]MBT5352317.1 DMT family transporter [Rhodospirillales bacterium]MBT6111626.1 DMT family transporter [Rhodospirillales bacterium]